MILDALYQPQVNSEGDLYSSLSIEPVISGPLPEEDFLFSVNEIQRVIGGLPDPIAPGLDGIRTEQAKCLFHYHLQFLVAMFNSCLKWGFFPHNGELGNLSFFRNRANL